MRRLSLALSFCCANFFAFAQLCTTPGQTPVSAIFVCGTESFTHSTTTFCGQIQVPISCPSDPAYFDKNPTFFRFACYSSGTLGFIITPQDLAANLNWQLFDITSTNPVDIFTNPALFMAANWSSEPGPTGASADGTELRVCVGPGLNPFSKMPDIVAGRSYMLMLSNESATSAPFNLLFTGGSASITDATDPHLRDAATSCDRTKVRVRMNKSLLCNSIAPDGSDFTISGVNVISALPYDCSSVFGTDIITLTLDQPLPLGTHTVVIRTGNDGNSLIDICNRSVPVGESVPLISANPVPTTMDAIRYKTCSPAYIDLQFAKPIQCSSIAADGSDFIITGPQNIIPTIDYSICTTIPNTVRLLLPPGYLPGNYQVRLATGTDGNTILDDCGMEVAPGATLNFQVVTGVSALFTQAGSVSCGRSEIQFMHDGQNGVTSWNWDFGNGITSSLQNPFVVFPTGQFQVRLIVSNGSCSDTSAQTLTISNSLTAGFDIPEAICAGDTLHIENRTTGLVDRWEWDFGNGMTSTAQSPVPPVFTASGQPAYYAIRLIATITAANCSDTVKKMLQVLPYCNLDIPTAFTPNGDGRNDYLYPLNALRAKDMEFRVFNRMGQLVFLSRNWTSKWDGRVNGVMQDTGVYAWIFTYKDESGRRVMRKGTVILIR